MDDYVVILTLRHIETNKVIIKHCLRSDIINDTLDFNLREYSVQEVVIKGAL